jgi:hypothetical protein
MARLSGGGLADPEDTSLLTAHDYGKAGDGGGDSSETLAENAQIMKELPEARAEVPGTVDLLQTG